jgi:hypothetical protein
MRVTPGSELASLIEHAERTGGSLVVDIGETAYQIRISSKGQAEPRSKRLKGKLLSFAGAWKDLDGDQLLEKLDRARHASPPSPAVQE